MQFYSLVSGMVPGFSTIGKRQYDNETLDLPTLQGTEDIIRPFGTYGFIKGDYQYNPYSVIKLQQRLKKRQEDIQNENLYNNVYDNPSGLEQWWGGEALPEIKQNLLSPLGDIWDIFKGSVTEDVNKFNKGLAK